MPDNSTLRVCVASLNPAKLAAVESAFTEVFTNPVSIEGVAVSSGVPDQPLSNEETLAGARNRVTNAEQAMPEADYWVGLEAGIEGEHTFAWMVISNGKTRGESRSAALPLPPAVLTGIAQGKELGDVMDEQFGTTNIKQQGGAIGLLTGGLLSRSSVYHQALILACIPFINPERFPAH
ncbi:inosine/xanthosine triphosphatase [Parendozoicomonas haliclonae]|uniref:Inosine/xanthosine triphosphatase n=1 Tax=Parendozoicomonas haliclonae TaxID=1960125 RepID=A0A1X7ALV2_9GAMM|nr:inosine/xanthosine triphosphatase [Parendozoicomonas haliclonae]SMA49048.1 Non-canonical purine NTP phosphatase [Parendozoicomonas haliclonae]